MRVLLKFDLDCPPDAAWRALRSPAVFRAVSQPFTTFESLEPGGFPDEWSAGEHPVRGRAFGLLPMGDQIIDVSFVETADGVRRVVDAGRGLSGPLALVTTWHHTMAVSPAPDGRTLYRDELRFGARALTPLLWPMFWVFWQWRGARLRRLAPTWG
jgi:hypothetical protein